MNLQVVLNKETLPFGHTWAWRSVPKREGNFLKKLPKKYSFWSRKGEVFDNVRTLEYFQKNLQILVYDFLVC